MDLAVGLALIRDPRVMIRHKLLLLGIAIYVISPLDLIPDVVLGLGQADDILVLCSEAGLSGIYVRRMLSRNIAIVSSKSHRNLPPRGNKERVGTKRTPSVIDLTKKRE